MVNHTWIDINPDWNNLGLYDELHIKPREFPKSSLTAQTLYDLLWPGHATNYINLGYYARQLATVADEAIKQYILDTEAEEFAQDELHDVEVARKGGFVGAAPVEVVR